MIICMIQSQTSVWIPSKTNISETKLFSPKKINDWSITSHHYMIGDKWISENDTWCIPFLFQWHNVFFIPYPPEQGNQAWKNCRTFIPLFYFDWWFHAHTQNALPGAKQLRGIMRSLPASLQIVRENAYTNTQEAASTILPSKKSEQWGLRRIARELHFPLELVAYF